MSWVNRAQGGAVVVARIVLALVFGLSALSKLAAPGLFEQDVFSYHLLPAALVGPFAFALPWLEAMLAVYLLLGLFTRPTAVATAALLVMFMGALAISLANGNTAHSCGCMNPDGPLGSLPVVQWLSGGASITPFDLVRDAVLLALAGVVFWGDGRFWSVDGWLFPRLTEREAAAPTGTRGPAPVVVTPPAPRPPIAPAANVGGPKPVRPATRPAANNDKPAARAAGLRPGDRGSGRRRR
jgi:uncharacterized membrane protein YphA (DoxX/SURF4 family)